MTAPERDGLRQLTNGAGPSDMAKALLNAYDPDAIREQAQRQHQLPPDVEPEPPQIEAAQQSLLREAASLFTGEVVDYVENIRKVHEQIIDTVNIDQVTYAGWDAQAQEQSATLVQDFAQFIENNKDEITALRIFYNLPYQRRTVTLPMIREVLDILQAQKPQLAPARVWQAYARLDNVQPANPISELTTLVALIRRVEGLDERFTPYASTVDRNFQSWIFGKQAGALKFNEAQVAWLRMIKDHIAASFHIEVEDLDYAPFDGDGGLGRMYELFGEELNSILDEMNEALVA